MEALETYKNMVRISHFCKEQLLSAGPIWPQIIAQPYKRPTYVATVLDQFNEERQKANVKKQLQNNVNTHTPNDPTKPILK